MELEETKLPATESPETKEADISTAVCPKTATNDIREEAKIESLPPEKEAKPSVAGESLICITPNDALPNITLQVADT